MFMKKIIFYVEGISDEVFLKSILNRIDNYQYEIITVGGWEKIVLAKNSFKYNNDLGYKNIIFFDADADSKKRREEILSKFEDIKLIDDIFLFPDNENPGDLETILLSIINPKNTSINDCFDEYKKCIESLSIDNSYLDNKTKVFTYLSLLNKKAKEQNRDYSDPDAWNLEHDLILKIEQYLNKIAKDTI